MTIEIVNVTINTPVVEVVNVTVNPSGVQTVTVSVDDTASNTVAIAANAVAIAANTASINTLNDLMKNEKVYTGVGNAATTTSTAYGTPALTPTNTLAFTKLYAGTSLLITLSASSFHSTSAGSTFGVSINGVDYDMQRAFHNTASTHRGWTLTKEITGISAGAKTLLVRWKTDGGTLTMDSNDSVSLNVREVLR
jgi:hypothetical protein